MTTTNDSARQNLTINLERRTIRKAKILAAKSATSISRLLARQIEDLVEKDEAYELAKRQALRLLDEGFELGGVIHASREELHDRKDLRR